MSLCVSIRPVYVSVCALVCVPSCGAEAMGAVAGDRGCGSYGDTGNRFITTLASMVISKHDMMT